MQTYINKQIWINNKYGIRLNVNSLTSAIKLNDTGDLTKIRWPVLLRSNGVSKIGVLFCWGALLCQKWVHRAGRLLPDRKPRQPDPLVEGTHNSQARSATMSTWLTPAGVTFNSHVLSVGRKLTESQAAVWAHRAGQSSASVTVDALATRFIIRRSICRENCTAVDGQTQKARYQPKFVS